MNYSKQHSTDRFEERYGYGLSSSDYDKLVKDVRTMIANNQNIESKTKIENGWSYVLKFNFNGIDVMPTFETERDTITTFLPLNNKVTVVGYDNESSAVEKLYELSKQPYVRHVYGLPDLTYNNPCPVGTSAEVYNHIIPAWIGTDIGCGVVLFELETNIDTVDYKETAKTLLANYQKTELSNTIFQEIKNKYGVTEDRFDEKLGTIGGGNHFAELMQVVNSTLLDPTKLYLCVHTGSRDFGVYVQEQFKDHKILKPSDKEFNEFMMWHDQCVNWSKASRELIALKWCKVAGLKLNRKAFELTHNFIEKTKGNVFVHRKGSIPSNNGPALIPGSRGAHSYLVQNGTNGVLHSLPHGAGRKFSRAQAKEMFGDFKVKDMVTTELGSYVVTDSKPDLVTEHPLCYKDLNEIIKMLETDYGLNVLASLKPLITVKF